MVAMIGRRLAELIMMFFVISFLCFCIFKYMGNPVYSLVGMEGTEKQYKEAAEYLGLNKHVTVQYAIFIKDVFHGNFGISYTTRRPVFDLIAERFPATFELVIVASLLSVFLGAILGIYTAVARDKLLSKLLMTFTLIGISAPTFLIGAILILIFSVTLGWLPAMGRGEVVTFGSWSFGLLTTDGLLHLILPAMTLTVFQLALTVRLIRAEMIEVLASDYITTAWSKGVSPFNVYLKHAFRNAFQPALTMIALLFVLALAFSVVVESIFQWPGLGQLLITAINENDYPIIVVYILFVAVALVFSNLIVDILHTFLDPRLRHE